MLKATLNSNHRVVLDACPNSGRLPGLVQDRIDAKISVIQQGLKDLGIADFEILLSGALVCGHYSAPKPSSHSLNPLCKYPEVIECDMRVLVPPHVQLNDPDTIQALKSAIQANSDYWYSGRITRFNIEGPTARFYDYELVHDGLGLEFEICFNHKPYFEIAAVWRELFSDEDIETQRGARDLARDVLQVDYLTDFSELKAAQTMECRFRIMANYWVQLHGLQSLMTPDFKPLSIPAPEFLNDQITRWHLCEAGEGFERPVATIPDSIVSKAESRGIGDLLPRPPTDPAWLTRVLELRQGMGASAPAA